MFKTGDKVTVRVGDPEGPKVRAKVLYDEGDAFVAIKFTKNQPTMPYGGKLGHVILSLGEAIERETAGDTGLWIERGRLTKVAMGRKPGFHIGNRVRLRDEQDALFVREPGPQPPATGTVKAIEGGILGVSWDGYTMGHNLHDKDSQPILDDNSGWWVADRKVKHGYRKAERRVLKRSDVQSLDKNTLHVRVTKQTTVPVLGGDPDYDLSDPKYGYWDAYAATYKGRPAVVIPFVAGDVVLAEAQGDKWSVR